MAEVVALFLLGSDAAGLTATGTASALAVLALTVPLGAVAFATSALVLHSREAEETARRLRFWLLRAGLGRSVVEDRAVRAE
jgi:hypothetical protein